MTGRREQRREEKAPRARHRVTRPEVNAGTGSSWMCPGRRCEQLSAGLCFCESHCDNMIMVRTLNLKGNKSQLRSHWGSTQALWQLRAWSASGSEEAAMPKSKAELDTDLFWTRPLIRPVHCPDVPGCCCFGKRQNLSIHLVWLQGLVKSPQKGEHSPLKVVSPTDGTAISTGEKYLVLKALPERFVPSRRL